LSKFNSTLLKVEQAIENYRYSEAENLIYDFFWKNYCDWYLEVTKGKFSDENIQKVAFSILLNSIKMMHPFIPFVTEEIWEHLEISNDCLAVQPWPNDEKKLINKSADDEMQSLIDIISTIRNIKVQWNIKQQQTVNASFTSKNKKEVSLLNDNSQMLKTLAKIDDFSVSDKTQKIENSAAGLVKQIKFYIPLGDIIDVEKEKKRIVSQIEQHKRDMTNLDKRLKNKNFTSKAPPEVVEKEKARLDSLKIKVVDLDLIIKNLE